MSLTDSQNEHMCLIFNITSHNLNQVSCIQEFQFLGTVLIINYKIKQFNVCNVFMFRATTNYETKQLLGLACTSWEIV